MLIKRKLPRPLGLDDPLHQRVPLIAGSRMEVEHAARLHDGSLPVGTIRDHPDLPVRAVVRGVGRLLRGEAPCARASRGLGRRWRSL